MTLAEIKAKNEVFYRNAQIDTVIFAAAAVLGAFEAMIFLPNGLPPESQLLQFVFVCCEAVNIAVVMAGGLQTIHNYERIFSSLRQYPDHVHEIFPGSKNSGDINLS